MEPSKASFSFIGYKIEHINVNLSKSIEDEQINVDLQPSGKYFHSKSIFELQFVFIGQLNNNVEKIIEVQLVANFEFKNVESYANIPSFFYKNCIAIVFPYLRAAISTITLQCNAGILILPLYNLSNLEKTLIENTFEAE